MRIWTLHPKYLDAMGLVTLWREALLAQKILQGESRAYTGHPQLIRFRAQADPVAAISTYLAYVYEEAKRKGCQFDKGTIYPAWTSGKITCTRGQLIYEWQLLKDKVKKRDARHFHELLNVSLPDPHPVFMIVSGAIEPWERIRP